MKLKIEHCIRLARDNKPERKAIVVLKPDVLYNVGRFYNEQFGTPIQAQANKLGSSLPHSLINLSSDYPCYGKSCLTIQTIEDGKFIKVWIHNLAGIRIMGRGRGTRVYSRNQVVRIEMYPGYELEFSVPGQFSNTVSFKLFVEEDENDEIEDQKLDAACQQDAKQFPSPPPSHMSSQTMRYRGQFLARSLRTTYVEDAEQWATVTREIFEQASLCAAQENRSRHNVKLMLVYLAVVIYNTWCAEDHEFPSATQLGKFATCWLHTFSPKASKITPKQMTELGKSVASSYSLPVSSSVVWPVVGRTLTYMEVLSAVDAISIVNMMRSKGVRYEDFFLNQPSSAK